MDGPLAGAAAGEGYIPAGDEVLSSGGNREEAPSFSLLFSFDLLPVQPLRMIPTGSQSTRDPGRMGQLPGSPGQGRPGSRGRRQWRVNRSRLPGFL